MYKHIIIYFITLSVSKFVNCNVTGSNPTIEKTIEALFTDRSQAIYPVACKIIKSNHRQSRMCQKDPGLSNILKVAKEQAIGSCEEAFKFDRWNCSRVFNNKTTKSIFNKLYRESAYVHALMAASITHAVAKGCASGDLTRCSCRDNDIGNTSWQWKRGGCSDDFKYGKRITKNFLGFKSTENDQIGNILKQDVIIGIDAIGKQLREVCKCHGFSGSCTTKTCWKRLSPFSSAMGILKKHYHHALRQKLMNQTSKRTADPKLKQQLNNQRKKLIYLAKTPNLCRRTKGRNCKDRNNCATLCCGRGYITSKRLVSSECKCKMVNCCIVKCDTCTQEVDFYSCK